MDQLNTIKILTFGDSLTQGNPPPEFRHGNPGKFQSFMYARLVEFGLNNIDIHNHGIGGQLMHQIVGRIEPALNATPKASIIVLMGGTNDIWHFGMAAPDIETDIADDILFNLEKAINVTKKAKVTIMVCTIPPFGDVSSLDISIIQMVNAINEKIINYCNSYNVPICDVNNFMKIDNEFKFAKSSYVLNDGVHFTSEGNKACGECIANCLKKLLQ